MKKNIDLLHRLAEYAQRYADNCTKIGCHSLAAQVNVLLAGSTSWPAESSQLGYRVFQASYNWRGGYGAYDEREVIVTAENESRAHALVVAKYPDTCPGDWTFTEIDTGKSDCVFISGQSS